MSQNALQSRQYISTRVHSQICQDCRDTYLSAGGITDATLYVSLKAITRLPSWRHALEKLSRLLPVSDSQTLLVCNTKSFCALILGVREHKEALKEDPTILAECLCSAVRDVRTIIREGLLCLEHTRGGNSIRGIIRQSHIRQERRLIYAGPHTHDQKQPWTVTNSHDYAKSQPSQSKAEVQSARSVSSCGHWRGTKTSKSHNNDLFSTLNDWVTRSTITTALNGPEIIKPEVLLTVHALASYISDLPQNAVVILPMRNPKVPWLHDFMDEYVNVPDYKFLNSPYISRIRLLTIQIQSMKRRQHEPDAFNESTFSEIDVAITHNLGELHLQLLRTSYQEPGNLSETHRNALIFYMLSMELNWYWKPAIAQTYLVKIQEILNLYRGQLIRDEYFPFIVMSLFWYAAGDVLLSRYSPIDASLDWSMLLNMVDFDNLPLSTPYQMVLRSCFGMYYKFHAIQSMIKLPASMRPLDQLRNAKFELMNMLLALEKTQDDIAAVVGDSIMLRRWMEAAETSVFDLVVLLDDLEEVRAPAISQRILDGLETMLQGYEQPVVMNTGPGHLLQIVVALLSAFRSAKDKGAEYWWDRVFKATYRIDASKTGRAAWCRAAMMRYDDTKSILSVCHQFGREGIHT